MKSSSVKTRVTFIFDVACVWSYLGFTRLSHAASEYRETTGEVELTFRPFQVEPDASASGGSLAAHLARTFGSGAERRKATVAAMGAREGIALNFDRAIRTNTFDAHRLIAAAAAQGRAEPMVERLFRAHFTDGLNVGDPSTLDALAAEVGVVPSATNAAEVRADLERVLRSGITGVPVYLFDGRPPLVGDQSEGVLVAALWDGGRTGPP
jgi:predicted DsbA family dithiol-disulfide isomerase